ADVVAAKCHVLHYRPGRGCVISLPRCEQDGKSTLRVGPVSLKDIAFDQNSPGILKLEEVLHPPMYARVLGVADFPGERLEEMIGANLDVRRNESVHGGISPWEDEILAGRFQATVDDLERPGPVS